MAQVRAGSGAWVAMECTPEYTPEYDAAPGLFQPKPYCQAGVSRGMR